MIRNLAAVFACIIAVANVSAQVKSNDTIAREIRSLNADKQITVTLNQTTSKLMAVAENFDDREVGRAGIRAMNFALGVFYPGNALTAAPDPIMLSFWVLTKSPRFAVSHNLTIVSDGVSINVGEARYAAKPRENMEYLNYSFTRAQLQQIAAGTHVRALVGADEFTVSPAQAKLIRDFLTVSSL